MVDMAALGTRELSVYGSLFTPLAAASASTSSRALVGSRIRTRRDGATFIGGERVRLRSAFEGTVLPVTQTPSSITTPTRSPRVRALAAHTPLVQKVTAKELDAILTNERTSPMIIDFYATWCGPCVVLAQDLELLAVQYGRQVRFLKVDTDEEHELASQMEIRGLPTMVFVSKDVEKLAIRTEGLLPLKAIRDIIEKEILTSDN